MANITPTEEEKPALKLAEESLAYIHQVTKGKQIANDYNKRYPRGNPQKTLRQELGNLPICSDRELKVLIKKKTSILMEEAMLHHVNKEWRMAELKLQIAEQANRQVFAYALNPRGKPAEILKVQEENFGDKNFGSVTFGLLSGTDAVAKEIFERRRFYAKDQTPPPTITEMALIAETSPKGDLFEGNFPGLPEPQRPDPASKPEKPPEPSQPDPK